MLVFLCIQNTARTYSPFQVKTFSLSITPHICLFLNYHLWQGSLFNIPYMVNRDNIGIIDFRWKVPANTANKHYLSHKRNKRVHLNKCTTSLKDAILRSPLLFCYHNRVSCYFRNILVKPSSDQ